MRVGPQPPLNGIRQSPRSRQVCKNDAEQELLVKGKAQPQKGIGPSMNVHLHRTVSTSKD